MSQLRIAGLLPCSFVNGPGARYVVFTQGCKHNCPGCQNPDTRDFTGGYSVDVAELASVIREALDKHPLDGLTISGGDPYEQETACIELIKAVKAPSVWIYTGYTTEQIKNRELTKYADAVVTGPFIEALRCEGQYYGSSNQEVYRPENDEF